MIKYIFRQLLLFYKKNISPAIDAKCIYTPTCSMYTLDAIEKHGAFLGTGMGIMRILRCNPFRKGGFDPVKENFRGCAKWTL